LPEFQTFTGPVSKPLWGFRVDTPDRPITPAEELKWLRDNPARVARVRRYDVPLLPEINLSLPTFVFSLRLLDPREPDGWRLATISLPGTSAYNFEGETTLDDVWRSAAGDPAKENDFVLTALNEAACTGEDAGWANAVLNLLVLPNTSLLDPDDWGGDFTPYQPKP
jgi:hypothetical protein